MPVKWGRPNNKDAVRNRQEPANPQYLKQDSKNGYGEISWLPLSLHWTPGSIACIG